MILNIAIQLRIQFYGMSRFPRSLEVTVKKTLAMIVDKSSVNNTEENTIRNLSNSFADQFPEIIKKSSQFLCQTDYRSAHAQLSRLLNIVLNKMHLFMNIISLSIVRMKATSKQQQQLVKRKKRQLISKLNQWSGLFKFCFKILMRFSCICNYFNSSTSNTLFYFVIIIYIRIERNQFNKQQNFYSNY